MTDKNPNDTADVTHFTRTDCGELTRGQVILTLIETGGQNVNDLVGIPGSPREVDQFCHRALMGIVLYHVPWMMFSILCWLIRGASLSRQ